MQIRERQISTTLGLGGLAAALAVVAPNLEPVENIMLVLGLVGCAAILAHPFVGLVLIVALIQLGGLVNEFAGAQGEFVLEGLAAVTFAGLILQAPRRPRHNRWGTNPVPFRMAVLFLLAATVSALFADYQVEAATAVLRITSLVLLFYLIIVMANTKERVITLIVAILASAVLSGAISALGYAGIVQLLETAEGGRQVGASAMVATSAGNMFLVGTMIGGLLAIRMPRLRMLGAASFVFSCGGVIFSQARSALLVLVMGLGWFGAKIRHFRHFPAIALLAAIGVVAVVPFMPAGVWERLDELRNPQEDWTLGRRWGYHVVGFDLVAENPVLGVGPGNFGQHYVDFEYRWVEGRLLVTRALHNMYLSIAAENGLVGLALFLAMALTAMVGLNRVRKRSKDQTLAHLAEAVQFGLGVFLVAVVTMPAIANKMLWTLIALATAIYCIAESSDGARRLRANN